MFESLVTPIRESLITHHGLYTSRCRAEHWEEISSSALKKVGLGSDWKADYNHKVEVDHVTDCGLRISNKSGALNKKNKTLKFSGSRLTSHKTLEEKIAFISRRKTDFIFCLASDNRDDKYHNRPNAYYFCVIDTTAIDYANARWSTKMSEKTGKVSSYKCFGKEFTATISRSMSDQIWTTVDFSLISEIHEISL